MPRRAADQAGNGATYSKAFARSTEWPLCSTLQRESREQRRGVTTAPLRDWRLIPRTAGDKSEADGAANECPAAHGRSRLPTTVSRSASHRPGHPCKRTRATGPVPKPATRGAPWPRQSGCVAVS